MPQFIHECQTLISRRVMTRHHRVSGNKEALPTVLHGILSKEVISSFVHFLDTLFLWI